MRASATDARHPSFTLTRLLKVQIWREQRRANESGRSGGGYPRATTIFCKCEIAIITPATGILAIESKWCASWPWLVALSCAAGVLQQCTSFSGALGGQFAPQQPLVEHAVADGTLKLSGSRRIAKRIVRKRTTDTLTQLRKADNDAKQAHTKVLVRNSALLIARKPKVAAVCMGMANARIMRYEAAS